MILNPNSLTLDISSLRTATQPVSKQDCAHSTLADQRLDVLFIRKSFREIKGHYGLSPACPAVRYQCRRLFPDCWENLSYGRCYIVLMSMSRTETLEGEFGKGIRRKLEHLLADEEFQGTLEGQLTRIAVHLQKPVRVWNSRIIKSGILEDFIPPICDGDKVIKEGMITVSTQLSRVLDRYRSNRGAF
jgi:hypothetical protein